MNTRHSSQTAKLHDTCFTPLRSLKFVLFNEFMLETCFSGVFQEGLMWSAEVLKVKKHCLHHKWGPITASQFFLTFQPLNAKLGISVINFI